jgi:hypothetical protein
MTISNHNLSGRVMRQCIDLQRKSDINLALSAMLTILTPQLAAYAATLVQAVLK